MGLYSNIRRMATMFCAAISITTLMMLALRLTVFSDMAGAVSDNSLQTVSSIQGSEIEGDSDFPYKMNSKIYFQSSKDLGNVLISNPDTNKYLLKIDIILPDTKDSLFYTGALEPGVSIKDAKLSASGQKLINGVYECTAEISAVDPVTMASVASEKRPVSICIGVKP